MIAFKSDGKNCIFLYFTVFFLVTRFVSGIVLEDPLIMEIYQSYLKSLNIEEGTIQSRRVFSNNRDYDIHVMKLAEVNGKKRHNLMVKESNATNPLIYINNPVETKISHAFLTFEEFKKEMTDRVITLRQQFYQNVSNSGRQKIEPNDKQKYVKKDKGTKQYKTFLRQLRIELRNNNSTKLENKSTNPTNSTKRKNKQKTETNIAEKPIFRVYTLNTDPENARTTKQENRGKETVSKLILNSNKRQKLFTTPIFKSENDKILEITPAIIKKETVDTQNTNKGNKQTTLSISATTVDTNITTVIEQESVTNSTQNTNNNDKDTTASISEANNSGNTRSFKKDTVEKEIDNTKNTNNSDDKNIPTLETMIEHSADTTVSENSTELEVTKELITQSPEPTYEIESSSTQTTASTTKEPTSKRSTLDKPLVWVQDDPNQNDYK